MFLQSEHIVPQKLESDAIGF